jgi:uncharacterized protein (DUF58 family)
MTSKWKTKEIHRRELFNWAVVFLVPFFIFTPVAIVQFFCLFFLLILIVSRFYSEYLIRHLHVTRMDSELRVFRHEWVKVEIKIENRGMLPAFMLITTDSPEALQVFRMRKNLCTLERRAWKLLNWEGLCADRGVFSIGPAVIRGSDPLGLFPFHLTAKETSKLFVYPVIRSIAIKRSGGIPLGRMVSANPLYEDITRYRSLRPYNYGDEPRRINWKVSAHVSTQTFSSNLLVNEYEATASYPLMIFLNLNRNEYPVRKHRAYLERTIEAAAALCLKASRERQEIGLIFYTSNHEGGISVVAPSTAAFVPILERLAAVDWKISANSGESSSGDSAEIENPGQKIRASAICACAKVMLDQGKRLSYGTKYIYAGPDLGNEAYITLNSLKKYHIYTEYLIIDERAVPSLVPGNSPCYQMKESGYEII